MATRKSTKGRKWKSIRPEKKPARYTKLHAWAAHHGKSALWIAQQIRGSKNAVLRWMNGQVLPSLYAAHEIEKLTGIPPAYWLETYIAEEKDRRRSDDYPRSKASGRTPRVPQRASRRLQAQLQGVLTCRVCGRPLDEAGTEASKSYQADDAGPRGTGGAGRTEQKRSEVREATVAREEHKEPARSDDGSPFNGGSDTNRGGPVSGSSPTAILGSIATAPDPITLTDWFKLVGG